MEHILIIDDDRAFRWMLQQILEIHGYVCRDVEDGEKALHAIDTEHFDLMISDQNMPGMTGLQLLQQLSSRPKDKIPPVILVTGYLPDSLRSSAQRAGVDAFLTKPFTHTELLSVVRQVIDPQEQTDIPLARTKNTCQ
ncbi:MAG: response regulator [Nitrospirales bacterium]|nr:response regulator [Nitrospira sp.]MDR4501070.1 response regulator [Nitrospirales bacterium]